MSAPIGEIVQHPYHPSTSVKRMFAACLVLNTQLVPFSRPIVSSGLHTSAPTGRSLKQKLMHDILVRIRIRGSMPLTNGSGSCYFRHWPSRRQQKKEFLKKGFLLITGTFSLHLHKFTRIKGQKVTKQVGIKVFLLFLLVDRRIRIRTSLINGSESARSKSIRIRRIRIHNTDF
jgi:hypothetical protein